MTLAFLAPPPVGAFNRRWASYRYKQHVLEDVSQDWVETGAPSLALHLDLWEGNGLRVLRHGT